MAVINEVLSYGDTSIREDVVLNAVEILTAKETQIFNMLGKTTAISTIHSFLTDTLASAGSQAIAEDGDYTNLARTTPSRLTNVCELVAVPFKVSNTQSSVSHYHGEDELTRQTTKGLLEWANAAEFDLVRSTLVSGQSGVVPKMSGLIEATSKANNHTTHTSTTVWSASILDGLMKGNWDASNGDVATDIFMGSFLRNVTDGFTAKSNMVVNGGGLTTIVKSVSVYTTSFGTINIHTHRYIGQTSDAHGRVLAINPDKFKIAFLRAPMIDQNVASLGDYKARAVVGQFTLETHNQNSAFFADGLVNA